MPVLLRSRNSLRTDLSNLLVQFTLYGNTSYTEASRLPTSDIEAFFNSKAFADWRRGREAENKLQAAIVERLNEVIRGTGIVAKTVAKKRI